MHAVEMEGVRFDVWTHVSGHARLEAEVGSLRRANRLLEEEAERMGQRLAGTKGVLKDTLQQLHQATRRKDKVNGPQGFYSGQAFGIALIQLRPLPLHHIEFSLDLYMKA